MSQLHADTETLEFGHFKLDTRRRILLADGTPVALSSRAFDVLEFLIRNRERVVTRDEIVAYVWRGMAVGENNLSVQMSALRRALGEQASDHPLIVNIPGRGYRFVADLIPAASSDGELKQFSALVGDIYDAALDSSLWPSVLRSLCSFVPGAYGNIFIQDATNNDANAVFTWGVDPEYLQSYLETYAKEPDRRPPGEDPSAELRRLRRENEILRQERDILKRATAFSPRREVDEVRTHRPGEEGLPCPATLPGA